jgi:hypothetical protein
LLLAFEEAAATASAASIPELTVFRFLAILSFFVEIH